MGSGRGSSGGGGPSSERVLPGAAATPPDTEDYRTLVEIGSDYAYYAAVSEEGDITLEWVTGDFEGVTGYKLDQIGEQGGWLALIDPEDHIAVQGIVEAFFRNEPWKGELRVVRPDGSRAWTRTAARPIINDVGRLIGIYGAVQDITEQKRALHELERAETLYR